MFLSKIFTRRTDLFLKQKVNFFALTKGGPIILPPPVLRARNQNIRLFKDITVLAYIITSSFQFQCFTFS